MLRPPVKTSRHLDMKITCFGQVSFPPEGFVWRFCLSRLLLRFPRSNPSRSQPGMNRHPKATHQWLLMGRLNNPLACFILQPTGTPRPHINGFLWAAWKAPSSLSKVKPISQPARHEQAPQGHTSMASYGPLKQSLGMLHPAANRHPKATHQWLLMGRLNNPLACFILQPTGTPRPHINGFLCASKPAVCQPLDP